METKPKRSYRRITPAEIAKHKALQVLYGNGSAAVRHAYPEILAPKDRAYHIANKSDGVNTLDFIDDELQLIGQDAIKRLGMLVNSTDEKVATKNVQYAIDHLRGKPLQRSESKHLALTIEAVL